jgi:pyridoxal phosphate enzyme (YggS family)
VFPGSEQDGDKTVMTSVAENLSVIRSRIEAACLRAGREPSEVKLVGVTKTVPVDRIREGVKAGIHILGENYVQEARTKVEALADLDVSWHFIGHLQSNKVKMTLDWCHCIHTLDRESLGKELDRQAQKLGKRIPVLIQVNIGDEETKSGVSSENLSSLFEKTSSLDGLDIRGLMILPPYYDDPERVRPHFRKLRRLLSDLKQKAPSPETLTELSMGMSNDFEVAIEEGATLIRIGTALFGSRQG